MKSRSGKKKKKNAAEYAKQTPQATFESGTLRNTALRIWMENWVEDWKTFLSSICLICYWSVSLKPQDIAHLRTSILRLLVSLACKWPHLLGFQQLWPLFHTFIINNFKLLFLIYNLMDLTNLELCVLFKTVLTSANKKVREPTLYLLHIIVLRKHCLPVRHWSKSIFLLKQDLYLLMPARSAYTLPSVPLFLKTWLGTCFETIP